MFGEKVLFWLVFGNANLIRAHAVPLDKDYSKIDRKSLTPDDYFLENPLKLINQDFEVMPGLFEGGKFSIH